MNITQCRETEKLNPLCGCLLGLALADIKKQGITPLVVETYRSQERQNYLYCQGRIISECTKGGIGLSFAKAYSNPKAQTVTWTLHSIHTLKNAVDVIPQRRDKAGKWAAIWNAADKDTKAIVKTMERYGFEAGANWAKNPDSPHFQIKGVASAAKYFTVSNTNAFITRLIQSSLNRKIGAGLNIDGSWGPKTTAAVNRFRAARRWTQNGKMGVKALLELLK